MMVAQQRQLNQFILYVTPPQSQQAYLIKGSEASGVSHSGPQITNELFKVSSILHGCFKCQILTGLKVTDCIGQKNFLGISSDSTGNTKLVCEIVAKAIPWIIILPDVCHFLNNTAKDIGKITFFTNVSS